MKRTLVALSLACALLPALARAQAVPPPAGDGSQVLSTTPVEVFGPVTSRPRNYLWLVNVSSVGSASIWCSETVSTPGANLPHSYEIAPGTANGREFFARGYAPQGAIWCVAASGSAALTAEAN